jgi:hypothetical protein
MYSIHTGFQPINEAGTSITDRIANQYTLVLRIRTQTVLVARMGELKNETPSTSEVNKLGGLDWVCRHRNFVGRELNQRAG